MSARRKVEQWIRVAIESRDAAGVCCREALYRSAVSRAYYAIFATTTAVLIRNGLEPRPVEGTWPHVQLPELVAVHLRELLGQTGMRKLKSMLVIAYRERVIADYAPGRSVDREAAFRAVANAIAGVRLAKLVVD